MPCLFWSLWSLMACEGAEGDEGQTDGVAVTTLEGGEPEGETSSGSSDGGTDGDSAGDGDGDGGGTNGDGTSGDGDGDGTSGDGDGTSGDGDGDGTSGDGDGDGDGDGTGECASSQVFQGQATWYELAADLVNCSYPTPTLPPYYGAMNTAQYADAAMCGACVRVTGPKGTVDIQVVDQCPIDSNPICYDGHIDLNPAAFAQIGEIIDGIIPITWEVIACDSPGPISYTFKDGSSQWWTGVLVRNHRNPIAKFEYDTGGGNFKTVNRESYNYFVDASGFGPGPYTFRVTDIHGNTVTDVGIPLQVGNPIPGSSQFPSCE